MKYFIKTFGCQMNFSDSERMDSFLEEKGLKKVSRPEDADLIVINTCAVRQTAEDRVWGNLKNYKEKNPESKVVLTGCMAHRDDVQKNLAKYVDVFASVEEVWNKLSEAVASSETGFPENYLNIPPKYKHDDFAFVPIMTGCNNFCSYCVVPYARGREWSRSPKDIFEEIEKLNKKGVKEVLLLGQNVNSYRYGILNLESSILNKINSKFEIRNSKFKCRQHEELGFPQLLFFLAKTFPAINWRFLTSHPKDLSDELIEVIAGNENIPNEIHLPLQSGSDKVLRDMNRPYTQKHYLNLIKKIKNIIPGATITTDVIVGFPTETEEDFQETIKVFREARFDDAFINKYSPRPQTAAQKLGNPISWEEKKKAGERIKKRASAKMKKVLI